MTCPAAPSPAAPTRAAAAWAAVDVARAPAVEPVAVGGALHPAAVLAGYRAGAYPMPADPEVGEVNRILYEDDVAAGRSVLLPGPPGRDPYRLVWFSPDPRPVIPVDGVHLPRRLRKALRSGRLPWTTTAGTRFRDVVLACRRGRAPCWISDELVDTLTVLHAHGWAHSVEVWAGDDLVGGAFGIAAGGVFSADSMFSAVPDAGRVAIADLAARLAGTPVTVVDVQTPSPHALALGAVPIARRDYLALLGAGTAPLRLPGERRPVRDLGGATP